jgi:hypothetical protein
VKAVAGRHEIRASEPSRNSGRSRLGPGQGCRPLNRYHKHHFAERDAGLARTSARAIDDPNQVELLGDPCERAHVADTLGSDREGHAKISVADRLDRAECHLSRHRALSFGIPNGLGSYALPATIYFALKGVHFLHVSDSSDMLRIRRRTTAEACFDLSSPFRTKRMPRDYFRMATLGQLPLQELILARAYMHGELAAKQIRICHSCRTMERLVGAYLRLRFRNRGILHCVRSSRAQ